MSRRKSLSTHTTGTGGKTLGPGPVSSHPTHGTTPTGTVIVAAGERYPCDLCDRSFRRLHDRRRHYEIVHATPLVLHTCQFCRKDFSRADSLKRHIDNACNEMHGEHLNELSERMLKTTEEQTTRLNQPFTSLITGAHRKMEVTIETNGEDETRSLALFVDGTYVVSGSANGKIRRWQVRDGKQVGKPMDAGCLVRCISVSRDGRLVVSGTAEGGVVVWNADNHEKVNEFKAHDDWVYAVDVSSDATRIATGSGDSTVSVWSCSTSQRLLGPWIHGSGGVFAVKFSPDGRIIATATWRAFVRIYDSQSSGQLFEVPIEVNSLTNQSLAWTNNGEKLFALTHDGEIHCLDVLSGKTLSKWNVQGSNQSDCIALLNSDALIATSDGPSVSFWDTTTHKRVGSLTEHPSTVEFMAVSANRDIVIADKVKITIRSLCEIFRRDYHTDQDIRCTNIMGVDFANDDKVGVSEPIKATRAQETNSNETAFDLEKTVQGLRQELLTSQRTVSQREDTIKSLRAQEASSLAKLEKVVQDLRAQDVNSNRKIADLEKTIQRLDKQLVDSQQEANALACVVRAYEQKCQCETLYAAGRIMDAATTLLEITGSVSEEVRANKLIMDWLADFAKRCVSSLQIIGDEASKVGKHEEGLAAYSAALLLGAPTPDLLLVKWTNAMLVHRSVNETLEASVKFKVSRHLVYQTTCDVLEGKDQFMGAIECFSRMQSELTGDTSLPAEHATWEIDFRDRCVKKLEKLGNTAMDSQNNAQAIEYYTLALALDPANAADILFKRSKARATLGLWGEALLDADKVIELDPSSYKGYEMKHAALLGMMRHGEAFRAFETMLSKLEQSPDSRVRDFRLLFCDATPAIRKEIQQAVLHMPRVLIDATSGRLYDKEQQMVAFEQHPIFDELRCSMATQLDLPRIQKEVKIFFQYVMLSHRWDYGEPLFQRVVNISIFDLEPSHANVKLQAFCRLIHSLGFRWVWSDTCCIDKKDHVVLQESLVAMFTWYRSSSLTVVYLRGIWSHSQQPGDLRNSIWNTRAWTYQEYVAAEVIQFYTEDWKPYLGLDIFNHKKSPTIISEMQQAVGMPREPVVLCPGLDRVREKLYLASKRQTTLTEDIAYSLLGIFNVAVPVIYGEGNRAVGRFLEHILSGSGDVTILAWTGRSGGYNSCLPTDLTVYDQLVPSQIPQPIETAGMDSIVAMLRLSLPDLSLALTLYDHLNKLPSPSVAASRLCVPGIVFPIAELGDALESESDTDTHYVYRATTSALGEVEITTADDLSRMEDLLLVHAWVSPLLDQEHSQGVAVLDRTTRALRLVARLKQPFGALLVAPLSRVHYRRVAADRLIMVQIREETPLTELIGGVRTVDIQ